MAKGARKRILAKRKEQADKVAQALSDWRSVRDLGAVAEEDAWQELLAVCREAAEFADPE